MPRKIKTSNIATGAITQTVINNTGVIAGVYGSSTNVPVITVNSKGQLTTVTTASLPAGLATETYVNSAITSAIDNLVNSAPSALDTLNELASALGNDSNFATTISSSLGTKASVGELMMMETSLQNLMQARLPAGVIVMWSGSIATIPTGWLLCNGANGTPNLQDRFIVGAGSGYSVAATGGSKDATLVSHSHTYSGTTSTAGDHNHPIYNYRTNDFNGAWNYKGMVYSDDHQGTFYSYTDNAGNHNHTYSGSTTTEGSSATNANLPPYYALAYIMKA